MLLLFNRLNTGLLVVVLTILAAFPALGDVPRVGRFNTDDIGNSNYGRGFSLEDADGRTMTLENFRGKVLLLFFGFTFCADVCPTELARLAELRRSLGQDAERVRVAFVTLDPQRDNAAVMREYASAFDSSFVALRGSTARIAATADEFRVFHQRIPGSAPDRYTIDHSAYIYVFDPAGRLRLRFDPALSLTQMQQDILTLLAGL